MSKEDVPFRAMLAYRTFQKTGRTPDVEFFESDYFQKAADEADFNEMAEGYARNNAYEEDMDERNISFFDEPYAQMKADAQYRRKESKPARKDLSRIINNEKTGLQTVMDGYEDDDTDTALGAMSSIAGDNARVKMDANAPENPGEYTKMINDMSDYARQAITNLLLNELKIPDSDAQRYVMSFMDGFDDSKHDWNRRKKAVPYDHF